MPILTVTQTLIAALVSLVLGFGGGWVSNGWRLDARILQMQLDKSQELIVGLQDSQTKTESYQRKKDDAIKKAEQLARDNLRLSSALDSESDRVRKQLETDNAIIPKATHDSLVKYTASLNTVFNDCRAEITTLGKAATGHTVDIIKLTEAWPQDPTQ